MIAISKQIDTDVLVVGGGIAGLMAAIAARGEGDVDVLVAEKANTKRSGSGATGNDHFLCFNPDIQKIDAKTMIKEMLEGQVGPWHDTKITQVHIMRTFEMVQKWDSWGINMRPYGDQYVYMGHAFPGRPKMYIKYDGHNQKEVLTDKAKKSGAKLLNHHPVVDLLAVDGKIVGALALDTRKAEPSFTLIRAKAVIMATGCSTRLYTNGATPGWMFNIGNCPGCAGAMAQAYRIGAKLVNMEHPYRHAGTKYFARCGKATWIGVYKYPDGRPLGPFVTKPNREYGDNTADVWKSAFSDLMQNGMGPTYLDCSEASDEDRQFMRDGMISEGLTSQLEYMDREGIDPARHAVESQQYEPFLFGRGLEINTEGMSNIDGLYVAGDLIGNFRSGISGAATWGWISGENAARRVAGESRLEKAEELPFVRERLGLYENLLGRVDAPDWFEANLALQQIMSDYCPSGPHRVRSETLLNAGLGYLAMLREKTKNEMGATCSHTLMRGLEVLDLIDLGETVMLAARERRETRNLHVRSDYTFTNPLMGDKFINVFLENGKPTTAWRKRWMV
jgi:succinate dehydrogenase/fumarate reductase flavoprotein subunit